MNRRVLSIHAAGPLSAVLAVPSNMSSKTTSGSENENLREAYMWGYFRDSNGMLSKSLTPLLITESLKFSRIWKLDASRDFITVTGSKDGGSTSLIELYGFFDSKSSSKSLEPVYPFYMDGEPVASLYSSEPFGSVELGSSSYSFNSVKRVSVWNGNCFSLIIFC
jgi:hypothetical protein